MKKERSAVNKRKKANTKCTPSLIRVTRNGGARKEGSALDKVLIVRKSWQ